MNNSTESNVTKEEAICTFSYLDVNWTVRYVVGVLIIMCGVLTVLGNVISLVILNKPTMRTKYNRILSSLAVSDTLVGCCLCPLISAQLLSITVHRNCIVELVKNMFGPCMVGTSALNIGLLAYDRYVKLTSLRNYSLKMTNRKLLLLILAVWILPVVMFLTIFIDRLLFMMSMSVLGIGPLFVITICYFLLTNYVKKNSLRNGNEVSEQTKRKNAKLVKRLTVLVMCYIVCLFPLVVNFLFEVKNRLLGNGKSVVHQTLTVVTVFISSFNSVLNPIIYVAKFPKFKREFRKMFGIRTNRLATLEN